jgi:ABC-type glycerol-3-phosphate transport system substrate-binding protein
VDDKGDPKSPRTWEELREYATKLTVYRTPRDKRSGIVRLGFAPNYGNSWLYLYSWQAGGEFMNPERTRVTMNTPPNVRALKYMTDVYDELGGYAACKSFQEAQAGGAVDPFLTDRLAMKVDGDWFLSAIADWRRSMDFMVVPAPMPADELAKGRRPITWSGGFSYVIPATARQKDGAFKFMQYALSEEGIRVLERGKREQKESEGRLYLPSALANRRNQPEAHCRGDRRQPEDPTVVQARVRDVSRAAGRHEDPPGDGGGADALDAARERAGGRRAARLS